MIVMVLINVLCWLCGRRRVSQLTWMSRSRVTKMRKMKQRRHLLDNNMMTQVYRWVGRVSSFAVHLLAHLTYREDFMTSMLNENVKFSVKCSCRCESNANWQLLQEMSSRRCYQSDIVMLGCRYTGCDTQLPLTGVIRSCTLAVKRKLL